MGWGNFLKAVAYNIDIFAGPVVTLMYPLYASIRAIETPSRLDDQQWLTYWVLYSFITLFELTFSKVLEWLPFWPYLKLVATCWLVLPMFNGAAFVYENYVRKIILNPKYDSRFNPAQKKLVNMMNPSTRGVVERYLEQNGHEAFDRLMRKSRLKRRRNLATSQYMTMIMMSMKDIDLTKPIGSYIGCWLGFAVGITNVAVVPFLNEPVN